MFHRMFHRTLYAEFAAEVKTSLLPAMLAAGAVTDEDDPRWTSASVSGVANTLSKSKLDVTRMGDAQVRQAISFLECFGAIPDGDCRGPTPI